MPFIHEPPLLFTVAAEKGDDVELQLGIEVLRRQIPKGIQSHAANRANEDCAANRRQALC